MESTHDLSVGELLEQLLADSLIDACQISGESLTIVQGTNRHSFPYDQAHTFLTGMLRGRSWNLKPSQGADTAECSDSSAPAPTPAYTPSASETLLAPSPGSALVPTLESLLSMATEMDLIEAWERDADGESVTIVLPACRTQLRSDEAVNFLSECILHQLETIRAEVGRLLETAGRERPSPRRESAPQADDARSSTVQSVGPLWKRLG